MATQQPWVWRKRRGILTILFLVCTAAAIVSPTQAVTGLAKRAVDFLLIGNPPDGPEQGSVSLPPQPELATSASTIQSHGQSFGATSPALEGTDPVGDVSTALETLANRSVPANTNPNAGTGTGDGRGASGGSPGRVNRSSGLSGGGGGGGIGGGGGGFRSPISPSLQTAAGKDIGSLALEIDDLLTIIDYSATEPAGPTSSSSNTGQPAPDGPVLVTVAGTPGLPPHFASPATEGPAGPTSSSSNIGQPAPDGPVLITVADTPGLPPHFASDPEALSLTSEEPQGSSTARKLELDVVAVPEPASLALLTMGLCAVLARRYRQRCRN